MGVLILAKCLCVKEEAAPFTEGNVYSRDVFTCVCRTPEGAPRPLLKPSFKKQGTLPSKLSASSPHTRRPSTQTSPVLSLRDGQIFQGRACWLFPYDIPSRFFLWRELAKARIILKVLYACECWRGGYIFATFWERLPCGDWISIKGIRHEC